MALQKLPSTKGKERSRDLHRLEEIKEMRYLKALQNPGKEQLLEKFNWMKSEQAMVELHQCLFLSFDCNMMVKMLGKTEEYVGFFFILQLLYKFQVRS